MTDLAFGILLTLEAGERHGYALIKELRQRTGRDALRTGTVYAALARLQDDGLVAEATAPPGSGDERRKYYAITPAGSAAARVEARRLDELLTLARAQNLLGGEA